MKKMIIGLCLLPMAGFAQTQVNPTLRDQAECKKKLQQELVKRGMVNENVCLDDSNYPNVSISMDNYKHDPGDPTKSINSGEIDAVGSLDTLLSNAMEKLNGLKKEVKGYSDGLPYGGSKYDTAMGFEACPSGKKVTQKVISYIKKIKDEEIKKHLSGLSLGTCLKSGKGSLSPQLDILRNHYLAVKRAEDFCNQVGIKKADCKSIAAGMPSPNLIKNAHNKDVKDALGGDYSGRCDERRGIKYNFYFPDEIAKEKEVKKGFYEPEYDIAGRQLQNKLQYASALDFMKNLNVHSDLFKNESKSESSEDLMKSKMFKDIDGDKERFRKMLSGTGCENNEYQVDNQRRKYWGIKRQLIDSEKSLEKSPNKERNSRFIEAVKSGDYQKFNSPEFKDIVKLASITSIPQEIGYYTELLQQSQQVALEVEEKNKQIYKLKNQKNGNNDEQIDKQIKWLNIDISELEKKISNRHPLLPKEVKELSKITSKIPRGFFSDPSNHEMVNLARTLLTGVQPSKRPKDYNSFTGEGDAFVSGKVTKFYNDKAGLKFKYAKGQIAVDRYPDSPYDPQTNNFPAADMHACGDISDALADYISTNANPNVLRSNLQAGEEVYIDPHNIDEVGIDNRIFNGMIQEDPDFKHPAAYNNNKAVAEKYSKKGWICKGCGSGIHVHDDGTVHFVSRNRSVKNEVVRFKEGGRTYEQWEKYPRRSSEANKTPFDVNSDSFSMGALQSLKVFTVKNCENCDCLKNAKNGAELKDVLKSKNAQSTSFINMNGEGANIDKNKKVKVHDKNTCVFTPPVPHSCNFDPEGDSPENQEISKVKENLYCALYDEIVQNTSEYLPINKEINLESSLKKYQAKCGNKIFPLSEEDCLKGAYNNTGDKIKTNSGGIQE